tara:strand:+ start:1998 stop:2678 length:681 start_codon:yes stop_codon:yes gene_type:complete
LAIHLNKNMGFKKNKYEIIKGAIPKKLANFIYKYLMLKRRVAITLFNTRYISPFTEYFGVWNDTQVLKTYSHYADIVMETLLTEVHPIIKKVTGLKLTPNYSYARIYKKGDILRRHKDRFSCEISTTLNLGGGCWPIYLELDKSKKRVDPKTGDYKPSKNKKIKVMLQPGDMLVYRGNDLEHWRDKLSFDDYGQVFLHYNDTATKGSKENLYDRRPHLGLPAWFKK